MKSYLPKGFPGINLSHKLVRHIFLLYITILLSTLILFSTYSLNLVSTDLLLYIVGFLTVIFLVYLVIFSRSLSESIESFENLQKKYEEENQSLNNGVISLLHGVHKLSQKDLTVKMDINDDATAPITESLNLLIKDTADVLQVVVDISKDIAESCCSVKEHSQTVTNYSKIEFEEVESANTELNTASRAMSEVATLAQACSQSADQALESTSQAKETVINTVDGIKRIREIIRETEKRIKRLGERSQEISGIVSLINSISERTHILALNASIHASSSGESGKSFIVIADEVQRLAENSREATDQISSLVNNIQLETNKTVKIMNDVITEVINGTNLAKKAGEQMQDTMTRADQLVNMVQQIKNTTEEQLIIASQITKRAKSIKDSTYRTGIELDEQNKYADKLVDISSNLVEAISVFKLPDRNSNSEKIN